MLFNEEIKEEKKKGRRKAKEIVKKCSSRRGAVFNCRGTLEELRHWKKKMGKKTFFVRRRIGNV